MAAKPTDAGEGLPNGSGSPLAPPAKRGRGRPKGSPNKTKFNLFPRTITRVPKVVQLFCAAPIAEKERKPGRPKKKLLGRPRKIPLSPEEEAEIRERQKHLKRRSWKPLGRPRIHPIGSLKKPSQGRPGRPRKYNYSPSRAAQAAPAAAAGPPTPAGPVVKRGRGRPPGTPNKRRTQRFCHQKKKSSPLVQAGKQQVGEPRRRGRPPGSGKAQKRQQQDAADGPPRKRGRPPGSKKPPKEKPKAGDGGEARKRGRPRGAVGRKKRRQQARYSGPASHDDDLTNLCEPVEEEEEEEEGQLLQEAAVGQTPLEGEAEIEGGAKGGAEVVKATAVGKSSSKRKSAAH